MDIKLTTIELPLKVVWKISRNSSTAKTNFIVTLTDAGLDPVKSECAPNIRYGETVESIQHEFTEFVRRWELQGKSRESYKSNLKQVKLHSLAFALESALIKLESLKKGIPLWQHLDVPTPKALATSFSIPIIDPSEIKDYVAPLSRFESLKLKVDADSAKDLVKELRRHWSKKVRVDGNEAWKDYDEYRRFEEALKGSVVEFVEQPFPASGSVMYRALFKETKQKIMADESIENVDNLDDLRNQFHAINIKLMKTGSLLVARDLLIQARFLGFQTMIGCMIETSLGISYGMQFSGLVDWADLDGFLLIKDDPFRLVREAEGSLTLN